MSNIPIISVQGVIGLATVATCVYNVDESCRFESERKEGRLSSSKRLAISKRTKFVDSNFQREVSRELIRNMIHYIYIYIFLTENLVTLFTGNSRNNFIGRVAMNIAI